MCSKCGELLNNGNLLCDMCGNENVPFTGDVDYIKKMKDLITSAPFIMGCVLITLGTLGSVFLLPWWMGLLEAAFSAVYIVALWLMVYEALFSRRRKIDKTLLALKLFKIAALLTLVIMVVVFAATMVEVIPGSMYGGLFAAMVAAYIFIFVLIILAAFGLGIFLAVMLYIRPLFKVLKAIERRITLRQHAPLDGLNLFTVFSLVGVVSAFILALADNQAMEGLLFVIFNGVGMVLCLYTLRKFN